MANSENGFCPCYRGDDIQACDEGHVIWQDIMLIVTDCHNWQHQRCSKFNQV